jgi:hypothetical protein
MIGGPDRLKLRCRPTLLIQRIDDEALAVR